LVFGTQDHDKVKSPPSSHYFKEIKNVWENSHYQDFGIERLFRLFLVTSKLLFPGIYIKVLTRNLTLQSRKIYGELYVVFKTILPFIMLYHSLWHHQWLYIFNIYLLIETFLYVFYKIFLPENNREKLINRSVILLFFNFFELIASFGVIYAAGNYLNIPINSWVDALYFSFITGVTIGYGDFYPTSLYGKLFTVGYIISGVSVVLYSITNLTHRERLEKSFEKTYDTVVKIFDTIKSNKNH
jgi:hypothetical protein